MFGFVLGTGYSSIISVVMVMVMVVVMICVWKCLWHCLVWYDLIWVNVDRHFTCPVVTVSRICEMCDKESQITTLGNQTPGLGEMNGCKKCCSTGASGELFGGT